MPRPGVDVVSRAAPPTRGAPSDTGVWMLAGLADKGPTDVAVQVRNLSEFEKTFGPRVTYGLLWDALDVFFREGGTNAYVSRVVGPAATYDQITLNDAGAVASLTVRSIGQGATNLAVQVIAGATVGTFILVITDNGVEVERSPELVDPAGAATWSTGSAYVRVTAAGVNDPAVVAATALNGGNDDRAAITDTERTAALTRFSKDLGPGQVSYPGATTTTMHAAVLNHASTNRRVALLDAPDTGSSTTLTAAADAVRAASTLALGAEVRGGLFAPWVVVPGIVRGTTRTVPPSSVAAGLMARSDGVTRNTNVPAAAANGVSRYAVSLSQAAFTDAVRETLNTRGVNLFRSVYDAIRLYGYRTLGVSTDPWVSLASARLRMEIESEVDAIAEQFVFAQLDGKGRKIAEFGGALTGALQRHWTKGALFGDGPADSFIVDVGPTVNTPTTIANNELHAVIGLRMSPFGELVYIEIVKIPVTDTL